MLHRLTMIARADTPLNIGAFKSELGRNLACLMDACMDRQVTGALVQDSGHYLAILEGDADALCAMQEKFEVHGRISNFHKLEFAALDAREFRTWSDGAPRSESEPSRLIKKFQTIVPTADEVRTQVRNLISHGVWAENPPLVSSAA